MGGCQFTVPSEDRANHQHAVALRDDKTRLWTMGPHSALLLQRCPGPTHPLFSRGALRPTQSYSRAQSSPDDYASSTSQSRCPGRIPRTPFPNIVGRKDLLTMAIRTIGIIMNGVSGRMGTNQHLVRSILAIREQGGLVLPDGDRLVPDPLLVGR